MQNESKETGTPRAARLSGWASAAALVVLLAFAGFVVFMLAAIGKTEIEWSRLAWIFASVEAIAFAAAGALFGSSVHRERAEKAEAAAKENANAAASGKALAATLKAEGSAGSGADQGGFEALGGQAQEGSATAVTMRHAALARQLFPE